MIVGSRTIARAMATRCFCPPESITPFSPTIVSSPCGNCCKSLLIREMWIARSSSSSVRSALLMRTFSRSVWLNRKVDCGT